MDAFRYRRRTFALILSALITLPVEYCFFQTHGVYEEALDQIDWGINHHDYSRWAIFPALLIPQSVRAFHIAQKKFYGRVGLEVTPYPLAG
jgi:hypothetical protein